MAIDKELLDQLLAGRDPQELFAKDGLLDDLKKALSERILNAELDARLDNEAPKAGAYPMTSFQFIPSVPARSIAGGRGGVHYPQGGIPSAASGLRMAATLQ